MACSNGSFQLESPAFADGDRIPHLHSGNGLNLSPPLHWRGTPEGCRSLALVMDDADAPGGPWLHWLLFNIPASQRRLPAGLERAEQLANGTRHGRCWGVQAFSRTGYQGPEPPEGELHRYRFALHALDAPLELPPGCTLPDLEGAMAGHRLATATLTGLYGVAKASPTQMRQSAAM